MTCPPCTNDCNEGRNCPARSEQAIAELESQEPYALEALMYSNDRIKVDPVTGNVSIGTPQRTWVGLTDEQKQTAVWTDGTFGTGALWAEAKLKEKNL